ncbi:MAG TPA: iron ABC transporter permease [Spirochaetota bacterium]|nr:iron ABC transporter permease [Spirochaetota bacterium]HPJ34070.1 iron ABC transporter permease [Spirochaetota bacterium]
MKKGYAAAAVTALLAGAVLAGISFGTELISPLEAIASLFMEGSLKGEIILKLRFPRVVAALMVGASLSVCGAVFQSVFRNPLADPFITGVSGGAALGYSIAVIFFPAPGLAMFSAFCGSLFSVLIIFFLSRSAGFTGSIFILSGVAMSFIFSSSVMLLFSVARSESVHKTVIWMMGDLNSSGEYLAVLSVIAAGLMIVLWLFHRHLDILAFGTDFSRSSGVTSLEIRIIIVLASTLAALSVALGGIVPFVGLMVPHFVRFFAGAGNFALIPLSAAAGGAFLVSCDAVSRSVVVPFEIPVGVITGMTGGIFFLVYVLRSRREL